LRGAPAPIRQLADEGKQSQVNLVEIASSTRFNIGSPRNDKRIIV